MNRCVQCRAEALEQTTTEHTVEAAGRTFTATVPTLRCGACGETYTADADLERVELAAAKALADSGEVTGETFRAMRYALGMNAKALAELLDVAPETISRWERGEREADRFAWLTVAALVADALEGRTTTRDRLRALRERPGLAKSVHLDVPAPRELAGAGE